MNPQTRRLLSFTAAVSIALIGLSMAAGQSPFEIRVFVDNDTLTVYVPQTGVISLDGFGFQVVVNGATQAMRLQDYPAFGLPFNTIITPICFRLRKSGTTIPLALECPPNLTLTQDLAPANVFWYDSVSNTSRVITLTLNGTPFAFCPSGNSVCGVTLTPPTHTPPPTATDTPTTTITPTITNTPEFTALPAETPISEMPLTSAPYPRFEGHNTDWTPQIETINGIDVALVPPGCFTMGSVDFEDAPPHEQCIDEPFYIGVTEVTNAQYRRCVDDGACTPPLQEIRDFDNPDYSNHPVSEVTWLQSRDFVEWWGGRLPTEREWEYAARGVDDWAYPWGDEVGGSEANGGYEHSYNRTSPVGVFLEDMSWVGAFDMSGNVSEWTNSLKQDYPYDLDDGREADTGSRTDIRRVLRGDSWAILIRHVADRMGYPPDSLSIDFGFRVAVSSIS